MKLYHGSNIDIKEIDLSKCRPYKDFGQGFYLTELKDQAVKMAKRVARIYGGSPCVNIYEIDESIFESTDLNIKNFGKIPSDKWAKFVMNNRSRNFKDFSSVECNLDNKYDIVVGPIANDDMAVLFRQYINEMIDFETLLKGMTYKELTSQYSFHTERAVSLLKKAGIKYV